MNLNQAQTAGQRFRIVNSADTLSQLGSGGFFSIPILSSCKNFSSLRYIIVNEPQAIPIQGDTSILPNPTFSRHNLLTLTGYISYTNNYQAFIDTPVSERNLMQQTVQGRLQGVFKERYPFNINFSYRFNNSSLFKDYFDLGLNYNAEDFKRLLLRAFRDQVNTRLSDYQRELDSLLALVKPLTPDLTQKYMSLSMPNAPQVETERNERLFLRQQETKFDLYEDSLRALSGRGERKGMNYFKSFQHKGDSSVSSIQSKIPSTKFDTASRLRGMVDTNKEKYDSLITKIEKLKKKIGAARDSIQSYKNLDYSKLAEENVFDTSNMRSARLARIYKILLSVKTVSLGRTVVNYSDLTVRQLSLNGINLEVNPGYYFAVTAGKIDFRFRDYIVRNASVKGQRFAMIRVGKGFIDKDHVVLSYFYGQRQSFNSILNAQSNQLIQPGNNLAGISLEAAKRIGSNGLLTMEIAKSSAPYYVLDTLNGVKWMRGISNFSERHNEAYSLKYVQGFKKIDLTVQAGVKYLGAKYQSFSVINTGSYQIGWHFKVKQSFLKKRIQFQGSIQQNEYSNPFSILTYRSTNIVASAFASFRFKKLPFFSIGYYPTQQVLKLSDNSLSIHQYRTLMATAVKNFKIGKQFGTSMLMFNQFKGSSKDSGSYLNDFSSVQWSNSVVLKKVMVGLNLSSQVSNRTAFNTVETECSYSPFQWLSFSSNLKLSVLQGSKSLYKGYGGSINFKVGILGDVSVSFDWTYVPYMLNSIVKNEYGRLTYYKTF